jgi:hypothetical protein
VWQLMTTKKPGNATREIVSATKQAREPNLPVTYHCDGRINVSCYAWACWLFFDWLRSAAGSYVMWRISYSRRLALTVSQ